MEVSEIQKAKSASQVQKKEGISQSKPVDGLSISSESGKKAEWVSMLKEMPDMRPEKMEGALKSSPSSLELASVMLKADT